MGNAASTVVHEKAKTEALISLSLEQFIVFSLCVICEFHPFCLTTYNAI